MLAPFPSRIPSSILRCPPSSLLSVCSSYSLSSPCSARPWCGALSRGFSASNNEKGAAPKAAKPNSVQAVASAFAAWPRKENIFFSRDHLLRQADLPEYTRKWPQLAHITNSELKQNGAAPHTQFSAEHRHMPYPQSPAAARLLERIKQQQPVTASSSSAASSSSGLRGVSDWSDDSVHDADLDDDEGEHFSLSQLAAMEAALVHGALMLRVNQVETSLSQLSEKLKQLQPHNRPNNAKTAKKAANPTDKVETAAPMKRKPGRPKKAAQTAAANSTADEFSHTLASLQATAPPTAAEAAEFMSTSPARAQLYRKSEEEISELAQARISELAALQAIASVALPNAAHSANTNTVRKTAKATVAADAADSTERVTEQEEAGVLLDSTKRKRRRKMNRHQYKKRCKLERQKTRTSNKKIHLS